MTTITHAEDLTELALQLLVRECESAHLASLRYRQVLPELIALIEREHDQPAMHLARTIRLRLMDYSFINDAGDHCHDAAALQRVDEAVELLTEVLEQVRQRGIADGRWSDAPVTPQMFG